MKKIALVFTALAVTTIGAPASSLFSDNFNYPDGPLVTGSGGIWATHSGTAGEADVKSGMVNLTQAESEDVNALLSGGAPVTGVLYYGLNVDFSALSSYAAGGYFAHFKDASTGFRARLFVTTTGAAAGSYRLGIANGQNTVSSIFPVDLALGTWHLAVVRYDTTAVATTLWVDPMQESDTSVAAADVVLANDVVGIALRQSRTSNTGMGTLQADALKVATTFVEVIPEPTGLLPLGLLSLAAVKLLRRRN